MGKNIVLCADGTGNDGGTGSDTNVFKIYQAAKKIRKIGGGTVAYYDRGVGTSSNKFLRALGGGFGWGFRQNVRELYEYLAQHYKHKDGDEIYIFGFSRGAATVRAFAGMLEHCGLVTQDTVDSQNSENNLEKYTLDEMIEKAMESYEKRKTGNESDHKLPFDTNRNVKIKFMGVWDTVAALGLPQCKWIDSFLDRFLHHYSYNFEPKTCVKNVYHAIAVDDERETFCPKVWDETKFEGEKIEQVWFSGVHSNVGGGYPREGLANITLHWMMKNLADHDLDFGDDFIDEVKSESYSQGKIYDSRSGLAIYYRYNPRQIKDLCENKMTSIQIHESVLKRMEQNTRGYAPGNLPAKFEGVNTEDPPQTKTVDMTKDQDFGNAEKKIKSFVRNRRCLYKIFLWSFILLIAASIYLWITVPDDFINDQWICLDEELKNDQRICLDDELDKNQRWFGVNWVLGHVADILRYFLPDFFNGAITFGVIKYPFFLLVIPTVSGLMYWKRNKYMKGMKKEKINMRNAVLKKWGGRQEN